MGIYCAVYGCIGSTESKHRFPNPEKYPDLFRKWVILCGKVELLEKPAKKIFDNCRVCRKHFTEDSFGRNNSLLRIAYPSLNLPENPNPLELQTARIVEGEIQSDDTTPDLEVVSEPADESDVTLAATPSTSKAAFEACHSGSPKPSTSFKTTIEAPEQDVRENLLAAVGKKRVADLSPKSSFLYSKASYYRKKTMSSVKTQQSLKEKLTQATKRSHSDLLAEATSSMDRVRARFFQSQLENVNKRPHGRRYSVEDKLLALALQKQSGSGYRLLSRIFNLPSRNSLQRLLDKVPVKPGLNSACFNLFKNTKFKSEVDKYCILIFDEMSIAPHLQYNVKDDVVEGFETFGYRTTEKIANYAQVFMLRGIVNKWKQPVYYTASQGPTKAADIVRIIKLLTTEAQKSGLIILCTVCDQGSNNAAALKNLISSTRTHFLKNNMEYIQNTFSINGMGIVPLFDVPHLMKGIRNNLLKYDLCFSVDSKEKTAKWEHIWTAYKMDPYVGNIRCMPRLTDFHVNPTKIKKMKVSYCTQVFSNSVARAINLMAYSGTEVVIDNQCLKLPKAAMDTADCCQFFDELFDSLNGSNFNSAKTWRKAVSNNSGHVDFWVKSITELKSMYFKDAKGGNRKPPSLKNTIMTLENFKILFEKFSSIGLKNMMPRTFNQDPIEKFFGKIRQRSYRYNNPSLSSFGVLYKSLLVNNLTSKHSVQSNCEDDESSMFFTLKKFIVEDVTDIEKPTPLPFAIPMFSYRPAHLLHKQVLCYMSCYIVKNIKSYKTCEECRSNLVTIETSEEHRFTSMKEFQTNRSLHYININILENIKKCYLIIMYILNNHICANNLKATIVATLSGKVCFEHICCIHGANVQIVIQQVLTEILIRNYIKQINNIMSGKDLRLMTKHQPKMFLQAKNIYTKRCKISST